MANQLGMDKSLAVQNLHRQGMSEREIARALGISRNAVRRHKSLIHPKDTTAPTGSEDSKSTRAPTGSSHSPGKGQSSCEPFREIILAKLEQGLDCRCIHRDLVDEHGFKNQYWSVHRFVQSLGGKSELPYRRMEVEPGWKCRSILGLVVHAKTTLARCDERTSFELY